MKLEAQKLFACLRKRQDSKQTILKLHVLFNLPLATDWQDRSRPVQSSPRSFFATTHKEFLPLVLYSELRRPPHSPFLMDLRVNGML